jgi:hypothetical protein
MRENEARSQVVGGSALGSNFGGTDRNFDDSQKKDLRANSNGGFG